MKLKSASKLVFIGDSVTDAGRTRPIGEGLFDAHGKGYVSLINSFLWSSYADLAIRVVNMGCAGDTVRHLNTRWQTDVHDLSPDWLSIMIGINDVWRQYDLPQQEETHVLLDEYEDILGVLVEKTQSTLKGLVLMTPFMIEPSKSEPMRATMDKYGAVVKRLAKKHNAIFVDTQTAFDQSMIHLHPMSIAWDRIHPNAIGHMILAKAFLKGIGFEY